MSEVTIFWSLDKSPFSSAAVEEFLSFTFTYVFRATSTSPRTVFLSAAYPDRKGAENILKQERKSEKPYDVCFYADAGLREISAKEGNRQAQAMTVYLKGNPEGYDWQAAALTEGDPDGCVIDGTTAWELFGNKVPGGQILFQGRTYTVRKVADWGQKILVFGAASADDTETELFYNRLFIRRRNGETEESTVNGFLMKYGLQGTVVSSTLPKNAGLAALLLLPAVLSCFRIFSAPFLSG